MKNPQGRMRRIQWEKLPFFLKTSGVRHITLCLRKAVEDMNG
jgi:hypothetical protein